jgi:predicted nuclease with RNAse H fold
VKLIGVDIGFSTTRATTAIALLDGNEVRLVRTWESREAEISREFQPSVIALDGPLLPRGADEHVGGL